MDDFENLVQRIDAEGKQRFGDDWPRLLGAVGRQTGGLTPEAMKQVLAQPDPAAQLARAGRENLLTEVANGNRDSERAYAEMRERERAEYRRYKGRT